MDFKFLLKNPIHLTHLAILCLFVGIALMSWSSYCYGPGKAFNNPEVDICKQEDKTDLESAKVAFFTLTAFLVFLVGMFTFMNSTKSWPRMMGSMDGFTSSFGIRN